MRDLWNLLYNYASAVLLVPDIQFLEGIGVAIL